MKKITGIGFIGMLISLNTSAQSPLPWRGKACNTDCYVVNGESGEQLITWVKKAMETHSLLVILFHEWAALMR